MNHEPLIPINHAINLAGKLEMIARNRAIAAFTVTGLMLLAGLLIAFTAFREIEAAAEARKFSYTIINQANDLLSELRDAETGQRGYALTGEQVFLTPYLKAQQYLDKHLQSLSNITLIPEAKTHLTRLIPLFSAKMASMAKAIVNRNAVPILPAPELGDETQGRLIMDAIRTEMAGFVAIEERRLAENEAQFQATLLRLFGIMVAASLMTVCFALWFAYLIYLQAKQHVSHLVHLKTQDLLLLQEQSNTLLTHANNTLQANEEKLSVTLKSIGDAVIATDVEACVTLLNPVAELLTGWTEADAKGRKVDEIFHIISQETRQATTIPIMAALARGTVQGLANHTILIARSGIEYAIADSCAPIRAKTGEVIGAVLVFRNVTAEYQAQQQLRDSAALVHSVFNTVVDGIITLHSCGGLIASVNPATERMFGYSSDALIGTHINVLIPDFKANPCDMCLEYAQAQADDCGLSREVMGQRKNGKLFPLEMAISEMDLGGQRFFTGILRDNTARKEAEAERALLYQQLQAKNAELEDARAVADKANLAKSDFLSSMSHELRSPLNAILGFAQLMDANAASLTPSQKLGIGQILQSGWYLLDLINEILDLAIIESGRLSLSPEPVLLNDVLDDCLAMVTAQAQQSNIRLQFPLLHSPRYVEADRTRLKQALINLLTNAIKYNCLGGTVTVRCSANIGGRIRLSVQDLGAGLSSQQQAHLFQPFNRLGQENGAQEGTGIGLVVSKRLIELMGGTIGVDSVVGVGSVFWLELNASFAPKLALPKLPSSPIERVPAEATSPQRYTVLCVEDNPANLLLMQSLLAGRPELDLLTAADGYKGIELARKQQPDVILMDINLPGISGIKAMQMLLKDPLTAHIPVLALSANAMPQDIVNGMQAGFFSYLTKPIKVNEFMDALDLALNHNNVLPQKPPTRA